MTTATSPLQSTGLISTNSDPQVKKSAGLSDKANGHEALDLAENQDLAQSVEVRLIHPFPLLFH